jgi:hypothetical protein
MKDYFHKSEGHTRLAHALRQARFRGDNAPVVIDQPTAQIIVDAYKKRLEEARKREIINNRRKKLLNIETND